MVRSFVVAAEDSKRLKTLIQVASRFGIGVILERMGVTPPQSTKASDADPETLPQRTRATLEELGPGFVKLGQILATRTDLLPPEWIAEFEKLQSDAPTISFDILRPQVEEALGAPPETVFATFDPVPLAAASIAQVHRATTHDGQSLILKIQRPGIRAAMESDLRLIAHLAAIVEKASAEARRFEPSALIRQLAGAILEELDFTNEGRNADRIGRDFADNPNVIVPTIHWQWTSPSLLVMDYIEGTQPRSQSSLIEKGIDPAAIAALGADVVLEMILLNGRFHADPHPGNLLCVPGNRIALLDFGMIGHVSPRRREELIGFIRAFTDQDAALLADILTRWTARHPDDRKTDQNSRMTIAAERLIRRHGEGRLLLSPMISDFLAVMRDEHLSMPPDLLLIFKALLTIDGVLLGIQPEFNLTQALKRAACKIIHQRFSTDHLSRLITAIGWEAGAIGNDAPRLIRAAIRRLEDETGRQGAHEAIVRAIHRSGRNIAAAISVASLIIAAAIILQ